MAFAYATFREYPLVSSYGSFNIKGRRDHRDHLDRSMHNLQ